MFIVCKQLKYLEKGEFRDLNFIKSIKLGGNQLSVIIDNLFETQKYLEYLGNNRTDDAICIHPKEHNKQR